MTHTLELIFQAPTTSLIVPPTTTHLKVTIYFEYIRVCSTEHSVAWTTHIAQIQKQRDILTEGQLSRGLFSASCHMLFNVLRITPWKKNDHRIEG